MKVLVPSASTAVRTQLALLLALALCQAGALAAGRKATVQGWVIDSACYFVKDLKKPISGTCALECAAGGSPLVILGDDAVVYWPIDDQMPARGQNFRLVKFAGQRVKVSGMLFERGSSKALVIETINMIAAPNKGSK